MKTVLSKQDILNLVRAEPPLIQGYVNLQEQLQNGFDLTTAKVVIQNSGQIAVSNSQKISSCSLPCDGADFVTWSPGLCHYFQWMISLLKCCGIKLLPFKSVMWSSNAIWDAGCSGYLKL
jgi:hypothetical protein